LWKHFETAEGKRLETRIIEKVEASKGPDAWEFRTYQWNDAGDDVTEVIDGAENVLGTDHDIPAVEDCTECHSGGDNNAMGMAPLGPDQLTDAALGFSAIQLNHADSDTTLTSLMNDGWLSDAIATSDATIPGDATAQAALGYMHANCGHCHGGERPHGNMVVWIPVGTPTVEATTTYLDTVGVSVGPTMGMGLQDMPGTRIVAGDPTNSAIPWRMGKRTDDDAPMPPLATEVVDDDGLAAVEAWIVALGG
jgi:hypothetical protein